MPRNSVDAGRAPDERSDEFLSPETRKRYGCGARAAVKVLHLAVYMDRGLSLRSKAVNISRYDIAY